MDAIHEQKYAKPTAVQMQALPIGLAGRDILGVVCWTDKELEITDEANDRVNMMS
jgi:hypothetical protein